MAQDLSLEGLVLAQQQVDGRQVMTDVTLEQDVLHFLKEGVKCFWRFIRDVVRD